MQTIAKAQTTQTSSEILRIVDLSPFNELYEHLPDRWGSSFLEGFVWAEEI